MGSLCHFAQQVDPAGYFRKFRSEGFFVAAFHGKYQVESFEKLLVHAVRAMVADIQASLLHHLLRKLSGRMAL